MDSFDAAAKADHFLSLVITNQPNMWPSGGLSNPANAQGIALNLATMRAKLIEELKKQD